MKIKFLLLLAIASLLSACSSTDDNGVTITKGWFVYQDTLESNNS